MLSTDEQLKEIERILKSYLRLPFSSENIPGAIMEGVFGYVRGDEVLETYDFVDVVNKDKKTGWQVKSTKSTTPVTWKRAKLAGSDQLILESTQSKEALQILGDRIIDFCNEHIWKSFEDYDLDVIGYSRLISFKNGDLKYFEKELSTRDNPNIFDKDDFEWRWSVPKKTSKKEQLPALHGTHLPTGKKWWAWHGRGENQLHFTGEKYWWPEQPQLDFKFPENKIELERLIHFLDSL